jgi:hypothetical protein
MNPAKCARKGQIYVEVWYKPIPLREFDWCAYRDTEGLVGYGKTSEEAVTELLKMEGEE